MDTDTAPLALIAARVNRGDILTDSGLTVVDYDTTVCPGYIAWEMSDGSTRYARMTSMVEIAA